MSKGEIEHQHNIGAAGRRYQSITDLTQPHESWNSTKTRAAHRELHA